VKTTTKEKMSVAQIRRWRDPLYRKKIEVQLRERAKPVLRKIKERVRKSALGCWVWTGATRRGYGVVWEQSRHGYVLLHRWVWERKNGPIPRGMFVCHHCDNPPCIRPSHLFLGTPADNLADARSKGRLVSPYGEKAGRAKLVRQQVVKIRDRYDRGEATMSALAREYNLHSTTVRDIVLRRSWRWLV